MNNRKPNGMRRMIKRYVFKGELYVDNLNGYLIEYSDHTLAMSLLKHQHAEEIYKLLQQIPKGNSEHPQGEH
jgi:hypothetical protein